MNTTYEDVEDTILEGSELHRYLISQGFSDFEIVQRSDKTSPSVLNHFTKMSVVLPDICNRIKQKLKLMMFLSFKDGLTEELKRDVVLCPLLSPDDASWVCSVIFENKSELKYRHNCKLNWLSFWNSAGGSILSTPVAVAGITILTGWSISKYKHHIHRSQLQSMLKALRSLTRIVRRAFILLQDHEVLRRGYLMTYSGTSAWRLEDATPSMIQIMPDLRSTLSKILQSAQDYFLEVISELSDTQPLQMGFQQLSINNVLSEIKLPLDSDATSLKSLKRNLVDTMTLQSLFLRQLALCLSPSAWEQPSHGLDSKLFTICSNVTDFMLPLQSCLNASLIVHATAPSGNRKPQTNHIKISEPRLMAVNVAMHSATLHAQALLQHALAAEELTSHLENTNDQSLQMHLAASQSELIACQSCIKEADLRILQLTRDSSKNNSVVPLSPPLLSSTTSTPILVGYTDLEPYGEDQVFEATCREELGYQSDSSDELEPRFPVGIKNEAASLLLYQELQDVLAIRAEDMKLREARALGVLHQSGTQSNQIEIFNQSSSISTDIQDKNQSSPHENLTISNIVFEREVKIFTPVSKPELDLKLDDPAMSLISAPISVQEQSANVEMFTPDPKSKLDKLDMYPVSVPPSGNVCTFSTVSNATTGVRCSDTKSLAVMVAKIAQELPCQEECFESFSDNEN